jgi:hypothetical protein
MCFIICVLRIGFVVRHLFDKGGGDFEKSIAFALIGVLMVAMVFFVRIFSAKTKIVPVYRPNGCYSLMNWDIYDVTCIFGVTKR